MIVFRPGVSFALAHPAHALALGFGAGLAPVAPGTFGTLLAWLIDWWIGARLDPAMYLGLVAGGFLLGVWACSVTGTHLGVPDHGCMVWDEVIAFLLVLAIVPRDLAWQAAAFVLFRLFDIAKPAPIRQLERRLKGGFGVMADDLVAAGYVLLILAVAHRVLA